jgi:SAM-dependent methyltransferase
MRKLDLGCGTAKQEGAIGVDVIPLPGVDVVADLTRFPYPFPDNSFDIIYMLDIVEHLPDTIRVLEEVHRIARSGAAVHIRVVNWNHRYAAMDPTHVKLFTDQSFDFLGKRKGRSYYTHARFDVVSVRYGYNPTVKRYLRSNRILRFLSDYLCNILQSLDFELRVVK